MQGTDSAGGAANPVASPPVEGDELAPERSRRRRRRSQEYVEAIEALNRLKRRLWVSTAILALVCVGLVVWVWRSGQAMGDAQIIHQGQVSRLELQLREATSRAAEARRETESARAQVNALVDQRIPGLVRLQLERAIQVDRHFVRDVTFTSVSDGGETQGLELKLVVENTSSAAIEPRYRLQIFDPIGVQLGEFDSTRIVGDDSKTLRAGEIRSYFETLEFEGREVPAYFRLVSARR